LEKAILALYHNITWLFRFFGVLAMVAGELRRQRVLHQSTECLGRSSVKRTYNVSC